MQNSTAKPIPLTEHLKEYDLSQILAAVGEEIRTRHPEHNLELTWSTALLYVDFARDSALDGETRDEEMAKLSEAYSNVPTV